MLGAGPALGSVFGGLVANATTNWRWVLWMTAIPSGISMLLVIAFIPETNYHRTAEANKAGVTPAQFAEMRSNLQFSKRSALGLTNWYDRYVYAYVPTDVSSADDRKRNLFVYIFHTAASSTTSPGSAIRFGYVRIDPWLGHYTGYSQLDGFHRAIWLLDAWSRQHQHCGSLS